MSALQTFGGGHRLLPAAPAADIFRPFRPRTIGDSSYSFLRESIGFDRAVMIVL